MTSPAMRKLLAPKKKSAPRPVKWIKVRRDARYQRLVIRRTFACGQDDRQGGHMSRWQQGGSERSLLQTSTEE